MKTILKISFIFICSIIFVPKMDAQVFTSEFKVGLTMAEMDLEGANMYKTPKYGFSINLILGYKLKPGVIFESGFIMTKRGLRQHQDEFVQDSEGNYQYYDITKTIDANYMMVPLMIGYETNTSKPIAFNISAGGYAAMGFKGKTKTKGTIKDYIGNAVINETAINSGNSDTFSDTNLKKMDYGLLANASIIFAPVIVTVSYEYGLMNVSNNTQEMKNRNLSVSLGLRF